MLCLQSWGCSGQTWPWCISALSQSSAQDQCSPSTGVCRTWSEWSWLSPAGGDQGWRRRHCLSLISSLFVQLFWKQKLSFLLIKCVMQLTCHFQQLCFCNELGHWEQHNLGPGKSLHICRLLRASGHQLYELPCMDLTWVLQMWRMFLKCNSILQPEIRKVQT